MRLSLQMIVSLASLLICGVAQLRGADAGAPAAAPGMPMRFYVGTYTGTKPNDSKGIYLFELNPATGALTAEGLAAESESPSFLALSPNSRFLYAANESGKTGKVSAFAIADPHTGKLTALNQESSQGNSPCHVSVDASGRHVFVANYGSGTIAVFPVGADGKLGAPTCTIQHKGKGADPKRQEGPHAHCIVADPSGKHVLACDLGLDKVLVYQFDASKGTLTPNDPPAGIVAPGSGPRHLAFGAGGRFVYVVSEMGNTVTTFAYDASTGAMTNLQSVSTLPEGAPRGGTSAEIAIHPSGKFVYTSNRGHDSIAVFKVDAESGKLTPAGHTSSGGKGPRNFAIDPSGRWLVAAHQDSSNLVVFKIDPQTGALTPTGATAPVSKAVCVTFLPAEK